MLSNYKSILSADGSVHTVSHSLVRFTASSLPKMLSLTHLATHVASPALPHTRTSEMPAARFVTGVIRLSAPGAPVTSCRHAKAPSQMNRTVCTSHAVNAGAPKVEGEVGACYCRVMRSLAR